MKNLKITQSITDRQDASLKIYFRDVSKQALLTPEEELRLTLKAKEGDEIAIEKLIKANLRFVISVAKQYQNKGLPLIDLIQEGNIGLIQAIRLYDPSKGYRLISYAVWWIRQAIIKAISDHCRTVRVPVNQIINISKVTKAIEKFEQLNERVPTSVELEEDFNINTTITTLSKSISLESPLKSEDASCLLDIIPDNIQNTDEYTINNDTLNRLEAVLNKLPYRERDIIKLSFGINMQPMPNEEIAKRFGIGSERVRQLQKRALKKIKLKYSNILKDLL